MDSHPEEKDKTCKHGWNSILSIIIMGYLLVFTVTYHFCLLASIVWLTKAVDQTPLHCSLYRLVAATCCSLNWANTIRQSNMASAPELKSLKPTLLWAVSPWKYTMVGLVPPKNLRDTSVTSEGFYCSLMFNKEIATSSHQETLFSSNHQQHGQLRFVQGNGQHLQCMWNMNENEWTWSKTK